MTSSIVFVLCLFATSVSAQGAVPSDKASSSSGIMSDISDWVNAVRPLDPVHSQSASVSDIWMPPEPMLPDIDDDFPVASDLGFPAEPVLPVKDSTPGEGSILSGQVLPPPIDKPPKNPSNPSTGIFNLPADVLIKVTAPAIPGSLFPDIADPNQGSPTNVNFDAEIIDPNLLFPAETPNAPDPNVVDCNVMGFPAEKLPQKPDVPVNNPFAPDTSIPANTDGNQPIVELPLNKKVPVEILPEKPLLPSGAIMEPSLVNQFVPTEPQLTPLKPIVPLKTLPQETRLPPGAVAPSFPTEPHLQPLQPIVPVGTLPQTPFLPPGAIPELLPVAPSYPIPADMSGRPIAILSVGTLEPGKTPDTLPLDGPVFAGVGVQPDSFGVKNIPMTIDNAQLTDITNPRRVNDVLPTAGQGLTPSDPHWLELLANERPAKLDNGSIKLSFFYKMSLSHASVTNILTREHS